MKATIKIEFNNSNYDHVRTILEALQQSVERFDAFYHSDVSTSTFRLVKGAPFSDGE